MVMVIIYTVIFPSIWHQSPWRYMITSLTDNLAWSADIRHIPTNAHCAGTAKTGRSTYTYIHTHIRTYVHTYIHTYIHTYTHTYIPGP